MLQMYLFLPLFSWYNEWNLAGQSDGNEISKIYWLPFLATRHRPRQSRLHKGCRELSKRVPTYNFCGSVSSVQLCYKLVRSPVFC